MNVDPWSVLHVRTNHEKRVARHLATHSVEYYLPQYTERSQWTDRTVIIERPLFSGYLFVRYQSEAKRVVISAPGALRLLAQNEADKVDDAEIERIRRALASGCILRPHPRITTGARVRIRRGIFDGIEGIVTELRKNCLVVLAVSSVEQCFSLQLDLDDVEVLGRTPAKAMTLGRTQDTVA